MDTQRCQACLSWIAKLGALIPVSLVLGLIPIAGFGQHVDVGKAGWRSTVQCDSAAVYLHLSINSAIVKLLKKGDVVNVDLEIIGSDGGWSFVKEQGQRVRLGYVRSECLEREQATSHIVWQAQYTAWPSGSPDADLVESTPPKRSSRDQLEEEVDRVVAAKLLRLLSINEINQAPIERGVTFENQSAFFLPFLPTNFVHRTPRILLPSNGLPRNIFRTVVPVTSPGVFCNNVAPGLSSSFGASIVGGRASRRR